MKKSFILFYAMVLVSGISCFAANFQKETITENERSYLRFSASNYDTSKPISLLVLLHGMGGTMNQFDSIITAHDMPNSYNLVVVCPQALPEQDSIVNALNSSLPIFGYPKYNLNSVWNSGTSVPLDTQITNNPMFIYFFPTIAAAGKITINSSVDDVKFINDIINSTKQNFSIADNNVFIGGYSMGGSMCYKYISDPRQKANAVSAIYGYKGHEVELTSTPVPVCHFHSHDDDVVLFNGSVFNDSISKLIADLAENTGHSDAVVENCPNIADDGISVVLNKYETSGLPKIYFYEIDHATHDNILSGATNDIDITEKMLNFFGMEKIATGLNFSKTNNLKIYPNPATDYLVTSEGGRYQIFNLLGEVVANGQTTADAKISLNGLIQGIYILNLQTDGKNYVHKFSVQ